MPLNPNHLSMHPSIDLTVQVACWTPRALLAPPNQILLDCSCVER